MNESILDTMNRVEEGQPRARDQGPWVGWRQRLVLIRRNYSVQGGGLEPGNPLGDFQEVPVREESAIRADAGHNPQEDDGDHEARKDPYPHQAISNPQILNTSLSTIVSLRSAPVETNANGAPDSSANLAMYSRAFSGRSSNFDNPTVFSLHPGIVC